MSQYLLPPPPEREHFERQLQTIYTYGDQDALARYLRKTPSFISQNINPHSDKESLQFRVAYWQWATDCLSLEKGDLLFSLFKLDYESRRVGRFAITPSVNGTAEISRRLGDVIQADAGQSVDAKIYAVTQLELAVSVKKQELLYKKL